MYSLYQTTHILKQGANTIKTTSMTYCLNNFKYHYSLTAIYYNGVKNIQKLKTNIHGYYCINLIVTVIHNETASEHSTSVSPVLVSSFRKKIMPSLV